jgi:hypothetical protein
MRTPRRHGAGLLFFSRDTDKPGLYQRSVASFMAGRLWYLNIISAKRLLERFKASEVVKAASLSDLGIGPERAICAKQQRWEGLCS